MVVVVQILPPLPSTLPSLKAAGQRRRYLALQDANAIVFDERGTKVGGIFALLSARRPS